MTVTPNQVGQAGRVKAIRVHIANGQITGVAPPGVPDGPIDLCLVDDDGDEPVGEELARLNDALRRGFESMQAGRGRAAADVIADLRRR